MDDTISIDLKLPTIGGELTAFIEFDYDRSYKDFEKESPPDRGISYSERDEKREKFRESSGTKYYYPAWRLSFTLRSSDARYNAANACIYNKAKEHTKRKLFNDFYVSFEEALKKMKVLSKQSFQGTYSKMIGEMYNPKFQVMAENGKVYLDFWLSSGTHSFAHELDIETTEKIIEKLKEIPSKADEMMNDLIELAF